MANNTFVLDDISSEEKCLLYKDEDFYFKEIEITYITKYITIVEFNTKYFQKLISKERN